MAKIRRTLGTSGSPVTNDLGKNNSGLDNITRAASGSSLYKENSGASDVGGRMKKAGFVNGYFDGKILGFDSGKLTDAYTRMGNDSFNPFSNENDYEKIRKDNQSKVAAFTNMFGQFIGKTALNTVGGIVGSFYGIGSAVANGNISNLIDNSFLRGVDEASESLDEYAPVFTSQSDKDKGVFGIFSGLETTKSVSDAFAFTAGAVLSELAMQSLGNAATGGLAELGVGARIANYTNKLGRIIGGESAVGRTLVRGGEYIGVGDKLRRIGERAELAGAFLRDVDSPAVREIIESAAMKEGMSLEQLQNAMRVSQNFENFGSGIRRVISGSLYEGSLEGRQAYDRMIENAEATIEAQLTSEGFTGENRRLEKQRRMAASEDTAQEMMLGVTAVNIGLLTVSNALQFPTLFGMKSFPATRNVDNMSSLFVRNAETGIAEAVAKKGFAKAAEKTVKIAEHPFTEFMEETLQGVISKTAVNFHDRLSEARSQTAGLEHPTSEFMNAFGKAFTEEYTSKEGWEEGLIGAIVGGLGAPSFYRNSKGKIRPTMVGGIKDAIIGESKAEKAKIQDALDVLNSDTQLSSLRYNIEQSKLNSFSKNEKDKAVSADDEKAFESATTDEVFQHVANYLDKGLKSSLEEETAALDQMSPEEYTVKTRGEGTTVITTEEQKAELDAYKRKVKTYTDAYEKVFNSMRMDKMNDNPLNQRLLNHLAYAVAKDKEELLQFKNQSELLKQKGLKMTESELYTLALLHGKIGTLTNKDIEDELKKYDNAEHSDYTAKINKMIDDEYKANTKDEVINRKKDLKYLRDIKKKYGLDYAEFGRQLRKTYRETPVTEFGKLNLFYEAKGEEAYRKEFDFNHKFKEELKNRISDKIREANPYIKEDYISKDKLIDENDRIIERNKNLNKEAGDKFQQKQSEALDFLAGKPRKITLSDIQNYKDSLEKYKDQLTENDTVPRSFLDEIDGKNNKDVNKLLDSIAGTIQRREISLRVAANLYGLDGVNKAVQDVANAELVTNYNNNRFYRRALTHFIRHGSNDDSGAEAALAYKKLELSNKSLSDMTNEFKRMATDLEAESSKELFKALDAEVRAGNDLLESYRDYIEAEDAKDDAEQAVSTQAYENSSEKINEKIKKEIFQATEEEVSEAKSISDLVLEHGELVNSPKQSWKLYTNSVSSMRDDNLRDLVEKGAVGMNNVVYFRPSESFDLNDDTKSLMNERQLELYNRGRELFENDSTLIGNENVMDISRFMIDDILTFDDSDDAAIQFFTMTFVTNKEITNDFSIPLPDGTKNIIRRKEGERINSTSFLYSPYFVFDKNYDRAQKFADDLKQDRKYLADLRAEQENESIPSSQRMEIKKRADLLEVDVTARTLRANDATLYELRKQMLLGITIHNKSLSDESYALRALIKDFDYGNISEHTLDGQKLPVGEFNNFALFNPGQENYSNFNSEENFLADEATIQELFDQDKIALCYQDKSLVYLNSNKRVSFESKDSTEDTESVDGKEDVKKTQVKEDQQNDTPYSVGSMYFMHETKTGVLVPVRLSMNTISSSESVMRGLKKHIENSVNLIKEREQDHGKTLKIYDEEIDLEPGEFNGMFDDDIDAPKTLHKLLEYFLPHYKSTRDIDLPLMVYKSGEENQVLDNSDPSQVASTEGMSEDEALNAVLNGTATNKKSKSKPKLHVDFGTEKKTIQEFSESDLEDIMKNIGSMRFYFKKNLSVDQSKSGSEKLAKPNVLNFVFTSGLVTHGFDVKNNVEKIYSPYNEIDTDSGLTEKQVGLTITPMDDDVLGKAKRILGKAYANRDQKKQQFMPSLRTIFSFDTKYNRDNKIAFDLKSINRQTKYLIDKRFKQIIKERDINASSSETDRRLAYKDAVESQLSFMNSELESLKEKFKSPERKNLIDLISNQVNKFEKQFNDPKNANVFRAIYMNKSQSEYFDELNDLLFNSSELNNELSEILPGMNRPSANSSISFNSKEDGISRDKIESIISAINQNNELSKKYKEAGGKEFLPIDIEISSIDRDSKVDKFKTNKERLSTYIDKEGVPKTKNQPQESVKIHSQEPLFYETESGKLAKFDPSDIDKVFSFDKNGKMTRGVLYLHLSGYKKGKFIPLAIGTETLKENKTNSVKDNGKNTFRYISGINFFGHNKDLSLNKKENNAIENVMSEKKNSEDATPRLYAKLNPSKTAEDNYQEAMDEAMRALDEYSENAENIRQQFEELKAQNKPKPEKKSIESIAASEDDGLEQWEVENQLARNSRKANADMRWVLEDLTPDIEDGGDLDKYDPTIVTQGFLSDPKEYELRDFTKMPNANFKRFLEEKTGSEPGAAKELMLKAAEIDIVRAKNAMNEIVKSEISKIAPEETAKPEKKSIAGILGELTDEEIEEETKLVKRKVDDTKNMQATVLDVFSDSKQRQLKRSALTGNQDVINLIIDEALANNQGASNLNNDIFVSAVSAVSELENNKISNNDQVHMIAKAVFKNDYSKENTDAIIEEYNKNCKA